MTKWKIQGRANNLQDVLKFMIEEHEWNKDDMINFIRNPTKLHDPFLFQDMQKVIEKIDHYIKNKKKILIFGD